MLSGITDGSGSALLAFDNITVEVPVEAIRDAIQYQGINTNQILLDLKKESNDMSEPTPVDSVGAPVFPEGYSVVREDNPASVGLANINILKDGEIAGYLNWNIDTKVIENIEVKPEHRGQRLAQAAWAAAKEIEPELKHAQYRTPAGDRFAHSTGDYVPPLIPMGDWTQQELDEAEARAKTVESTEETLEDPTLQAHSQMIRDLIEQTGGTVDDETADKIRDAINQENMLDWSEAEDEDIIEAIAEVAGPEILEQASTEAETPVDSADTPRDPSVDESIPEALATPVLQYPGPENPGYSADNTTLDIVGKVMGNGTRIRASRDGATGTVIAVQNIDSRSGDRIPYVRVRFDDGRIAVRSALKVRVTDQDAQRVAPVERAPERPRPIPDVSGRLDVENPSTGVVATEGNIAGVNSLGITPEELVDLTNPNTRQVDFSQWGERAGEIARAGRERVTLESIKQLAVDLQIMSIEISEMPDSDDRLAKRAQYNDLKKKFNLMMNDTFGVREGVTFGSGEYTVSEASSNFYIDGTIEAIKGGKQGISLRQELAVRDKQDRGIGSVRRTITLKFEQDGTSHWEVKNEYLAINNQKDKKSGFATAYNRFMEDWYIANGVREVHVHAAGGGGYQGGFVWALNGFNWDGSRVAENEISQRLRWLSRNADNDGERAQINRLQEKFNNSRKGDAVNIDKAPTPMELALVGWYPGAKNWIGKKLMANNGWTGVKRLDPKAKEQIQAQNYDQIRAARKRVETKENKAGISREFSLTVNSNEFQNNNVELQPYLDDIRDVFTNNRSMAVLAPAAKTELARFISRELLKKTEDRQVPLKDIFQLRKVLDAEYTADHPSVTPKDFGVGKDLLTATLTQIETNTIPGFTVRRLGHDESGYNTTYLITHNDSGQTFYLKEDQLAENYQINPIRTEVEAGILVAGLGLRGGYETRASETNESILVMQQAGSNLALQGNPSIGYHVFNDGAIISSDDTVLRFETRDEFVDHLASPEDAVRITLLDLLINNQDRHNGNILIAVDASDSRKLRLLPIDHSLSGLGRSTKFDFNFEDVLDPGSDNIYNRTMSVLTKRMKQDDLLAVFRNEADRLRSELKNKSLVPSGPELALIEKEWGNINNYREAVNARLDMLLAPNGGMLPDMMDILKPGYWT
jgi:hypothetical protein